MDLELVTVGTELLLGFTVDTNSAELAQLLAPHGVQLVRGTTVPDSAPGIRSAVADALARTGAVIITGGLGPTKDDVTKAAVAEIFDAPLEFDDVLWTGLTERFRVLGRELAASNRTQAYVPRGATVLTNRWGTAPGLWLEGACGLVIMLPGVPYEMRKLAEHEVGPRLAARQPAHTSTAILSHVVRTAGIAESALNDMLSGLDRELAPITIAFLPQEAGVDVRLTSWGARADVARRDLERAAAEVVKRAGVHGYGHGDEDLAAVVLERARSAAMTIAVAESCTGGLVTGRLTAIPGSSDVVIGSIVAYHNKVKTEALQVPEDLLTSHGAVSEPVARAMADGARRVFDVDAAISVTGIAGPSGGSAGKPVGTVWFGLALGRETATVERVYPGDRRQVRHRAAAGALFELLRRLPS